MEKMSNYIYRILANSGCVFSSWAPSGFEPLYDDYNSNMGLKFYVKGKHHQGYVEVFYNRVYDLFQVTLKDKENNVVEVIDKVYFDEIVDIINKKVEYIDEYNDTYIITKDRGLCKRQTINDYARDFLVDESADYVVLANELTVDEHLAVLEACAKHVDSAISKTINVKNDYPFEAFKDIYLKAYKGGYVKGVTTYRDGSMIGVLSTNETKDNKKLQNVIKFTIRDTKFKKVYEN